MGRPLGSPNKPKSSVREWWARMTPEERSREMIRRQAIARGRDPNIIPGETAQQRKVRINYERKHSSDESLEGRKRRLDRERKRIKRQASTRSPFPDINPETPMSGSGTTIKSRLLEIENALTLLRGTVLSLKAELGFE
jgi:hypothetical protein